MTLAPLTDPWQKHKKAIKAKIFMAKDLLIAEK